MSFEAAVLVAVGGAPALLKVWLKDWGFRVEGLWGLGVRIWGFRVEGL